MLNRISVGLWALSVCGVAGTLASEPESSAPEWARGATWYRVIVPRFRNGEPSNDPQGTRDWTTNRKDAIVDTTPNGLYGVPDEHYGGDLQGLGARLPYLKRLGIDVLYLSPIFVAPSEHKYDPADLRHVDDSLAIAKSLEKIKGESDDPSTWQLSESDRLFLEFVREAHAQGLRVVLENVFSQAGMKSWAVRDIIEKRRQSACADWFRILAWEPKLEWETDSGYGNKLVPFKPAGDGFSPGVEAHLHAVTKRWMDPNGDGDPSDGIDGWAIFDAARMPRATLHRWRHQIRRINPNAVLIGDFPGNFPMTKSPVMPARNEFDLTINYSLAQPLCRFFDTQIGGSNSQRLTDSLKAVHPTPANSGSPWTISAVSGPNQGRLLNGIAHSFSSTTEPASIRKAHDNWRLAAAVHFLSNRNPMLYYGDEAGMVADAGPAARAPMWWDDLPVAGSRSSDYRADFVALIRQLNGIRRRFAPLTRGAFREVRFDNKPSIIAFARSLSDEEIIVIINRGKRTEKVQVSVGWPGQLVGIINPELVPGPLHPLLQRRQAVEGGDKKSALRLFGSRQYADDWGDITVTVSPQSIRLVIVKNEEPR